VPNSPLVLSLASRVSSVLTGTPGSTLIEQSINTVSGASDNNDLTCDSASIESAGSGFLIEMKYEVNYKVNVEGLDEYTPIDQITVKIRSKSEGTFFGVNTVRVTVNGITPDSLSSQSVGRVIGAQWYEDTFVILKDPIRDTPWTVQRLKEVSIGFSIDISINTPTASAQTSVSTVQVGVTQGDSLGLPVATIVEEVESILRDTSIPSLVYRWINLTMSSIATRYELPFLFTLESFITEGGCRDYYLPANFLWGLDFWREDQYPPLAPVTEADLAILDPSFLTTSGDPTNYILHHQVLSLWRVPTSGIMINYTYQRRAKSVSASSTSLDFPPDWYDIIIQGAKVRGYEYERNPELASATQLYYKLLKDKLSTIYHRPDVRSAFQTTYFSSRTPRPQLPPNFPRAF
jgi:hypothetical protein